MNKNIRHVLFSLTFLLIILFLSFSGVKATETNFSLIIENPAPTNTSSLTFSGTSQVCSASRPGSAPTLFAAEPGNNSVTLTWAKAANPVTRYLIAYATTPGAMQYGNPNAGGPETTSSTIKGLSRGTTYYFRVKAINDCMPGDFSGVLSAAPTGVVINNTGPTENFVPAAEISRLLFDISLSIDSTVLNKSSDLVARTQFSSFGNVPTPVNMVYTVEDAGSKVVYSEKAEVTVETEQLVTKEFKNLNLGNGKYTLILSTTYGKDVKDEFKQVFEVKGISVSKGNSPMTIWIILIPVIAGICGFIIYLYIKQKRTSN